MYVYVCFTHLQPTPAVIIIKFQHDKYPKGRGFIKSWNSTEGRSLRERRRQRGGSKTYAKSLSV